jgi:hypothetical protein
MTSEEDMAWAVGLIEGEGSFVINIEGVGNKGKISPKLHPTLSISMVEKDKQALLKIKEIFGCGDINFKKKEYWIKKGILSAQNQYNYRLNNINDCLRICNILPKRLFKTTKLNAFVEWEKVVNMMVNFKHLEKDGLIEILKIRDLMNDTGFRTKNYRDVNFFMPFILKMEENGQYSSERIKVRKRLSIGARKTIN